MKVHYRLIGFLSIFTGLNTFATDSQIPRQELEQYVKSVVIKLRKSHISCTTSSYHSFLGYSYFSTDEVAVSEITRRLWKVNTGVISDSPSPSLILKSNRRDTSVVTIVTSADFKEIISVKVKDFTKKEINKGDLKNPNIEYVDKLCFKFECK